MPEFIFKLCLFVVLGVIAFTTLALAGLIVGVTTAVDSLIFGG